MAKYYKRERDYQADLIEKLHNIYPNAFVLKNDPNYLQGIPDISLLTEDGWAFLECKLEATSEHQPNQDYYVEHANSIAFARFIWPDNEEEVLNELQQSFEARRAARIPWSK